jgi:cytochrome P450
MTDAPARTFTFDWRSPEFLADPYAQYKAVRESTPIHFRDAQNSMTEVGGYVLTRYHDMVGVLRDHDRFSAERQGGPQIDEDIPKSMLGSDPPDHTRLRTLVNKAFTPRMIERLRTRVGEIVDSWLDRAERAGELEVIADFAYPLPITVISEMLGVDPEDHQLFREASNKIAVALGPIEDMSIAMKALEGRNQLLDYFREVLPQRRAEPRDDLISALIAVEEGGDSLTHGELMAMLLLLLVAGHETTVNLIGNGLLALLRNPDQLERLRTEDGIEKKAVEELLRYDSPVQFTGRIVMQDVEISGTAITAGQFVTCLLGSANRDPEVFEDPDTLDIGRDPCPHLSFSAGIHYCLGAQLARLEGEIALSRIVRRFPKLALATDDLTWRPAPILRGLEALPVTLS